MQYRITACPATWCFFFVLFSFIRIGFHLADLIEKDLNKGKLKMKEFHFCKGLGLLIGK